MQHFSARFQGEISFHSQGIGAAGHLEEQTSSGRPSFRLRESRLHIQKLEPDSGGRYQADEWI